MLSIKQLANILKSANLSEVERGANVSKHNLRRIRNEDNTVPYSDIEKVSEYYELGDE